MYTALLNRADKERKLTSIDKERFLPLDWVRWQFDYAAPKCGYSIALLCRLSIAGGSIQPPLRKGQD